MAREFTVRPGQAAALVKPAVLARKMFIQEWSLTPRVNSGKARAGEGHFLWHVEFC